MKIRTVLVSVFEKKGIIEFVRALIELGVTTVYASGGTAKCLADAGITVTDVSTLVGGGAILGHRVVTLSREVHAGLLATDSPDDTAELARLGIPRIDMVCVDMYPLEQAIAKPDRTLESVIDMTDIGGPTMLRSAAKGRRPSICDPHDRDKVIAWMRNGQPDEDVFVNRLNAKAEFVIAQYCLASARFRSSGAYEGFMGEKKMECKYGENAWQTPAALFTTGSSDPLGLDRLQSVEGDMPSYNNEVDIERLFQTMAHIAAAFQKNRGEVPLIAIGAKHGNCCGAAVGSTGETVVSIADRMMRGDELAIFGGLVMLNFPVTHEIAEALTLKPLDGIIAPRFAPSAVELLKRKKTNKCRFLMNPALESPAITGLDAAMRFRYVRGGFLVQPNYTYVLDLENDTVKQNKGSMYQENDMLLAWGIGSTSNSNTITLVKGGMLIGNAVGQQDRVGAAKLAIARAERSRHILTGSTAYSDSFFPFPDGPQALIYAGIKAILTSSASRNDQAVMDLCSQNDVPLYMIPDAKGRGFFGH